MQIVSDSFKKAIKSPNREIFGYVDIKYQNNNYSTNVEQIPSVLQSFSSNGIISGSKILKKYATLENNYTLLDGSFMVWNDNAIDDKGYVSDDVFNNIADNTIIIQNTTTTIATKGVTIYFKENLPFDFTVTITDINNYVYTENVKNNNSMVYQYIFTDEKYISQVSLNIDNIEYPNNRIRIAYVDFNLSDLYEGDELVNFDVNEEIDLLVESLPINTCSVNINNYPNKNGDNKFNTLNPKGIVKYLTDDTTIDPYIGVLTEENGVEYVHMGQFFLKDWQSNSDGNVTLNGVNCMDKIKDMNVVKSAQGFLENSFTQSQINTYLTNLTGFTFQLLTGTIHNTLLRDINLGNWLLARLPFYIGVLRDGEYIFRQVRITRDNVIKMNDFPANSIDNISRNFLLKDVVFENKSTISNVKISDFSNSDATGKFIATTNVINDNHIMSSNVEYVWYSLDKYTNIIDSTFSYTATQGGNAAIIDRNYYLVLVKFTGTIGETINITYNGDTFEDDAIKTNVWSSNKQGESIEIDFHNYFDANDTDLESTAKFYLTIDKPYKVIAQTMGDPSIETGDNVSIQTRYTDTNNGYKNIIITKQHFSFDGGLQCDIEGLGD